MKHQDGKAFYAGNKKYEEGWDRIFGDKCVRCGESGAKERFVFYLWTTHKAILCAECAAIAQMELSYLENDIGVI